AVDELLGTKHDRARRPPQFQILNTRDGARFIAYLNTYCQRPGSIAFFAHPGAAKRGAFGIAVQPKSTSADGYPCGRSGIGGYKRGRNLKPAVDYSGMRGATGGPQRAPGSRPP